MILREKLLSIIAFLFLLLIPPCFNSKYEKNLHDYSFDDELLVDTVYGKVLGKREGEVNIFLGIPYAEPPIGRLRFRPPRPKRPWYPSIYQAIEFAPECLQSNLYSKEDDTILPKDEDCLYLNIWQPRKKLKQSLLPVLIWVYGGAFIHGGSTKPEYAGHRIAEKGNVIVVSFNYRLGALGFLVSISDGLYGNYGLDDQRAAFQWVQENILSFGGDPERITLFGESAGAMSIGIHLLDQQNAFQKYQEYKKQMTARGFLSPKNDGGGRGGGPSSRKQSSPAFPPPKKLFHAVIMQSNPFGYKYRTISVANFIGSAYKELLDCEDLKCLQSEAPDELIHVQDTLMAIPRSIGDFFTWSPVITDESYWREVRLRPSPISNVSVFQPMDAIKLLSSGVNLPIIMGATKHEGTVFVFTAFKTRMNKFLYQFLLFSFFRNSAIKVMRMYRKLTKSLEESPYPDYRLVLSQIIGDYLFRCPNQYFASQLTGMGTAVFLYEFSLPTRTPGFPCCDGLSCHTCELPYVFHHLDIIETDYAWMPSEKGYPSSSSSSSSTSSTGRKEKSKSFTKPPSGATKFRNLELSFPDIFGAIGLNEENSGTFIDQMKDVSNQTTEDSFSRDIEVARLMSEYWTTFATYGDPNGLLSIDSNGYLSSTRPNAPWWPRLLGDLPSLQAVREIHGSIFAKAELIAKKQQSEQDSSAASSSYGKEKRLKNQKSLLKDGGLDDSYGLGAKQRNNRLIEASSSSMAETSPSEMMRSFSDPFFSLEQAATAGFSSTKSMHQMVFSDETEIAVIENDCICNAWNLLEYRF